MCARERQTEAGCVSQVGKTVQKDLLCRGLGLIWSLEEKGALSALPEAAWISHWESQYSEPHVC